MIPRAWCGVLRVGSSHLSIGFPRCFILLAPWLLGVRLGPYWLRVGWIELVLFSGRTKGLAPGWNIWLDKDRQGVGVT